MAQLPYKVGGEIRESLEEVSQAQTELVKALTKEWSKTASVRMGMFGRPELFNGYVTGLDNRPVLIQQEHTVLVYVLQSDEAIIMQYALVLLYEELLSRGYKHGDDFGFVANIHDEYQAEVRDDLVPEFKELAEWSIEQASRLLGCPVLQKGEADVGVNWSETH